MITITKRKVDTIDPEVKDTDVLVLGVVSPEFVPVSNYWKKV